MTVSNGEIIDEEGNHVGSIHGGVELTGEDDTDEMKALIDLVKSTDSGSKTVVDVTAQNVTPTPQLPISTGK